MAETLTLEIVAKLVDQASKPMEGMGTSFGKLTGSFAAGQLIANGASDAIHAMTGFITDSIKASNESQDILTQLNAVIKSTGQAAGVTAEAAVELSKSLQKSTTYSDEQVLSAENLLLTFTKINKDIFPQTTSIVLDMATALHEDLKSASIQVGKALQDPVLGITALRRVGVNFSADQKEVIKNLVATGQSAKAQQLILKELNNEFGGSATAAAHTYSGQMAQLANTFNDMQEKIGMAILDGIHPLMQSLVEFVNSDQFQAWLNKVVATLSRDLPLILNWLTTVAWPLFKQVVKDLWPVLKDIVGVMAELIEYFSKHKTATEILVAAIGSLTAAFIAYKIAISIQALLSAVAAAFGVLNASIAIGIPTVGGMTSAVWGLTVALAGPFVLAVVGIAAIVEAVNWVNELHRAWSGLQASEAAAAYTDDQFWKSLQKLPPDQRKARADAYNRSINFRAEGGPVSAGQPYVVGEVGAELFVPSTNGQIIPNNQLSSTNNFYAPIYLQTADAVREFLQVTGRNAQLAARGMTTVGG